MAERDLTLIGVFGGTFDPIHYGHLRIAQEIAELLSMKELRFIPAGAPRLRHSPMASPEHRAAMVRAALTDYPGFVLDEREVLRAGVSYSVDTLTELRQELGDDVALCFIIGADAFARLDGWHRWKELLGLCHFVVACRLGHEASPDRDKLSPQIRAEYDRRAVSSPEALRSARSGHVFMASTRLHDVSATRIRERIAQGRDVSDLLPPAVLDYIEANRLYVQEIDEA